MRCPRCQTVDLAMMDRSGIEVDYCPNCRGVWLDRGELDKLIERNAAYVESARVAPPPASPGYRRDDDDDRYRRSHDDDRYRHEDRYYGKRKKRDGFLDDIFDFG